MIVPKIKIEVTPDTLKDLNQVLSLITTIGLLNKIQLSVLQKVAAKLIKKAFSIPNRNNKYSLNIEYYQAHYLEEFLLSFNSENNVHSIQTVINDLNQKLA